MNNHALLNFTPRSGYLAIISKMLMGNNYSGLECIGEKNYKASSSDKKEVYVDLESGKLIFKYPSPEVKEKNKNFLKELEQSLLENSKKIY